MAGVTTISDADKTKLFEAVRENLAIYSGRGSSQYVTQTILSQHDRFGSSPIQINSEKVGFTFFTRPRLNFSTTSLRQDPQLAMLDIIDPLSQMFAVRCLLDTEFARNGPGRAAVAASPWLNPNSPFNIPMSNTLSSMSGWPDFNVDTETTEAGYFSEDMTMVRGSDRGRRTYDLSCTFREPQGGIMCSIIFYWLHMMALQMEGVTVAYPDDRVANRLNYTCSIYRFVMDPSMRTITKWAKATGCYPVNVPMGEMFNFGQGDSFIHASQQFTVQFKANNIAYMDPRHLQQFNTLMARYAGGANWTNGRTAAKADPQNNFKGLPFIDLFSGTNELKWMATAAELKDTTSETIAQILSGVDTTLSPLVDKLTAHLSEEITVTASST